MASCKGPIGHLIPGYITDEALPALKMKLRSTYDTKGSYSRFQLPFPKTDYGKKRFGYWGALIWNKLPEGTRECKSMNLFKSKLDRLLSRFFDSLLQP